MKYCYKCQEFKPLEDFCKNKSMKDGLARVCKNCNTAAAKKWRLDHSDEYRANLREWRKSNFEKNKLSSRNRKLKAKYNLTIADYDKMYLQQHGKCKICQKTSDELGQTLCVDHDHRTGKVRSLLCNSCNSLLGYAKESMETLSAAINYLNEMR